MIKQVNFVKLRWRSCHKSCK